KLVTGVQTCALPISPPSQQDCTDSSCTQPSNPSTPSTPPGNPNTNTGLIPTVNSNNPTSGPPNTKTVDTCIQDPSADICKKSPSSDTDTTPPDTTSGTTPAL